MPPGGSDRGSPRPGKGRSGPESTWRSGCHRARRPAAPRSRDGDADMCGIVGIAPPDSRRPDTGALRAMADAVAHRGPDDAGEHVAPGIGLASRRLAILDLTPAGHMPMQRADGRVVPSWNGEIYNHVELRDELKRHGARFRP